MFKWLQRLFVPKMFYSPCVIYTDAEGDTQESYSARLFLTQKEAEEYGELLKQDLMNEDDYTDIRGVFINEMFVKEWK